MLISITWLSCFLHGNPGDTIRKYRCTTIDRLVPKAEVKEQILSGSFWPKIAPRGYFVSVSYGES